MGAGRGQSCQVQGTILILVPTARCGPKGPEMSRAPAWGVAIAARARSRVPLAAPHPKSRRGPGSLPARLQRQRGPPGLCVGRWRRVWSRLRLG